MTSADTPPPQPSLHIRRGDLSRQEDQHAVLELLEDYARQLPAYHRSLPPEVRRNLPAALQHFPGCHIFLAHRGADVAGVAICFEGFSTFRSRRLLNLHDLSVRAAYQRQGIGQRLLHAVVAFARQEQFCGVTLEVAADNPARQLYARFGFAPLDGPCAAHLTLFAKLELP